mgnify:CR=1 FL=1
MTTDADPELFPQRLRNVKAKSRRFALFAIRYSSEQVTFTRRLIPAAPDPDSR